MRFRRRTGFRRRPRRFRRRRIAFRRRRRTAVRSGDLRVKLLKRDVLTAQNKSINVKSLSFIINDFQEYKDLSPNFEYVKIMKVKVKVVPNMNVSNNTTSRQSTYCLLPFHRAGPASASYGAYLSSDKAKVFRNTSIGRQTYVPNVHVANSTDTANASTDTIIWRPSIYTSKTQQAFPRIYCGVLAIDTVNADDATGTSGYDVFTEVHVIFKNQQILSAI